MIKICSFSFPIIHIICLTNLFSNFQIFFSFQVSLKTLGLWCYLQQLKSPGNFSRIIFALKKFNIQKDYIPNLFVLTEHLLIGGVVGGSRREGDKRSAWRHYYYYYYVVLCISTSFWVLRAPKSWSKQDNFGVPLRESTSFCMLTSFED